MRRLLHNITSSQDVSTERAMEFQAHQSLDRQKCAQRPTIMAYFGPSPPPTVVS